MLPIGNSTSFGYQPVAVLTNDELIAQADYHVVMHLLDTEMLTENQLNNIKSRFEESLTTQDNELINSMIDIVREANGLEQGAFVSPFNAVRDERSGRTVSATPDHDVRATANQPQASNQTLSGANRGNNDSSTVNQRSGQDVLIKVAARESVESKWSLDLVAQYCNKTDDEIDAEISGGDRATRLRLFDFQPMTNGQLNRIMDDRSVSIGKKRINQLSYRIEKCPPGMREINTPYWRKLFLNETPELFEETIKSDIIQVGRQVEYQRIFVPMIVIVSGQNYRDFMSRNPSGINDDTCQELVDISETILIRNDIDITSQTDNDNDNDNVRWTRTGYVMVRLISGITIGHYDELMRLNSEGIFNRQIIQNSSALQERQETLALQAAREAVNRENTIAALDWRMRQAELDSERSQGVFRTSIDEFEAAATSRLGVPVGWSNRSQAQSQELAKGGGAQAKPLTKEELATENEVFKKAKQCAYESCTNDYSTLYLHGSNKVAHLVHCNEHTLSENDQCPVCDQIIEGIVPIYLT